MNRGMKDVIFLNLLSHLWL